MCFYLRHLVYPVGFSEFYEIRYVTRPAEAGFYLPFLVLLGCGLALYAWQRKADTRLVCMACVWFLLPLLPTLDLQAFTLGEFVHDRYLYLSVLGVALVAGLAVEKLQGKAGAGRFPLRGAAACAVVGAALFTLTVRQTGIWKDNLALFSRCYQVSPHSRSASSNLAFALATRGRVAEAMALYRRILQDWPLEWTPNYDLGYLCYQQGDLGEAEKYLLRAIQISPKNSDQHFYLGLTWNRMGLREKAIESVQKAIELRPNAAGYHFALGVLLRQTGNELGACAAFRQELALAPDNSAAAAQLQRCAPQSPPSPPRAGAHLVIGFARAGQGRSCSKLMPWGNLSAAWPMVAGASLRSSKRPSRLQRPGRNCWTAGCTCIPCVPAAGFSRG